jgi:hypothetical protein
LSGPLTSAQNNEVIGIAREGMPAFFQLAIEIIEQNVRQKRT